MKKTKPKNKPAKAATTRMQSYYPSVKLDDSLKRFKEQALENVDGVSKNLTEKVIATIEIVLKTRPNFTYFDVLQQTKAFGIYSENVRPIYDRLTNYLVSVGKLERSESIYDGEESTMFIVHV